MMRSRADEMEHGFAQLSEEECDDLRLAAEGDWDGGDPLTGELRDKAAKLRLCFRSTGRLWPDVCRLLRGEDEACP